VSAEAFEVPPERLGAWLERWASEHGGGVRTETRPGRITFTAADAASVVCEPPFPPLPGPFGVAEGYDPAPLLAHAARERVVGVLLVRLGGHAVGVFVGRRLAASKVGTRNVQGRTAAGGQSQQRFQQRRLGQARVAHEAAADVAARVLLPRLPDLDAVVLGGDRFALAAVLDDPRLVTLSRLTTERVLDVPDPRLAVLRATPERFRATIVRPSD
jgi:hypothetical protein